MSDGLGILLALGAIVAPLVLAWLLIARGTGRREPRDPKPRKK